MTKRYFWRRLLAFFIDIIVLNLIVSIPVMMVGTLLAGFTMGPMASPGSCTPGQGREDVVRLMDLGPDEHASYFECRSTGLFQKDGETFLVIVTKRDGKLHFPKVATIADDGTGLRRTDAGPGFAALMPAVIIAFALPAAFAFFSTNGRQTLGKKLVGLHVLRTDEQRPELGQALVREYWKFLPYLILVVVSAAGILFLRDAILSRLDAALSQGGVVEFVKLLAIIPALQLSLLLWWLVPFVVWRGQTWHDRLAGTKVVAKTAPA